MRRGEGRRWEGEGRGGQGRGGQGMGIVYAYCVLHIGIDVCIVHA